MIETGIGKILNVALASLPNVKYPGDITPPGDILQEDIVTNEMSVTDQGLVRVPTEEGLGVGINSVKLNRYTIVKENFTSK